jgi:hypothetical protein
MITLENIHEEKEFLTRTLEGLGFRMERTVAIYMPLPTPHEAYQRQRTVRWDVYLRVKGELFRVTGKLSVPERAPREIMTDERALALRKTIIHRVLDEVDRPVII